MEPLKLQRYLVGWTLFFPYSRKSPYSHIIISITKRYSPYNDLLKIPYPYQLVRNSPIYPLFRQLKDQFDTVLTDSLD